MMNAVKGVIQDGRSAAFSFIQSISSISMSVSCMNWLTKESESSSSVNDWHN